EPLRLVTEKCATVVPGVPTVSGCQVGRWTRHWSEQTQKGRPDECRGPRGFRWDRRPSRKTVGRYGTARGGRAVEPYCAIRRSIGAARGAGGCRAAGIRVQRRRGGQGDHSPPQRSAGGGRLRG